MSIPGNTTPIAKHTALANSEDVTFSTISLQPTDGSHTAQAIDDECKACIVSTCIKSLAFSLNAVWLGFAIAALVRETNSSIVDKCHDSLLWPCLCACCVLSAVSALNTMINRKSDPENPPNMGGALCNLVLVIGIAIWGSVELSRPCAADGLDTSASYLMLMIWVVSTAAAVVGIMIGTCFLLYTFTTAEDTGPTSSVPHLNPTSRDLERGIQPEL